jgi:hypothetical protein
MEHSFDLIRFLWNVESGPSALLSFILVSTEIWAAVNAKPGPVKAHVNC